jgi:hypothetical protein
MARQGSGSVPAVERGPIGRRAPLIIVGLFAVVVVATATIASVHSSNPHGGASDVAQRASARHLGPVQTTPGSLPPLPVATSTAPPTVATPAPVGAVASGPSPSTSVQGSTDGGYPSYQSPIATGPPPGSATAGLQPPTIATPPQFIPTTAPGYYPPDNLPPTPYPYPTTSTTTTTVPAD